MEITLRKATPNDMDFLYSLRRSTMETYLKEIGAPAAEADHIARIEYQFDHARIVLVNGVPAGLFKAALQMEHQRWYLMQIQVSPEFQGGGIGRTVITRLIKQAEEDGLSVVLSVLKNNPAKVLYERIGFSIIGESDIEFEMMYHPQ